MESCDWLSVRSYQPNADSKRVRNLSHLLSHFHCLLCDVRVGTLRNGPVCISAATGTGTRAVVTDIRSEPDDLSDVGSDLRDHSSPHVGGESFEHKRCARRQRSFEQFRRFERNDTSGAYSQYFFDLDCVDPVHRQPHRSG